MSGPQSQVADLILQLMSRGRSGGLPMQASPELTQYLAHAQGGTAPPQIRGRPSADVLQGPGSGLRAVQEPMPGEFNGVDDFAPQSPVDPMEMLTDSPQAPTPGAVRPEAPADFDPNVTYIWYTNPQTGKRVRLDGPFTDDIAAHRAMKELQQSGMNAPLELSPY